MKISLKVEKSSDSIFVINEKFNLYGEGNTLSDAIEDFLEILSDDYDFYTNSPTEEFDELAKEVKRFYDKEFENE